MTDIDHATGLARPPQGLVTLTHLVYGLHAFSALTGLLGLSDGLKPQSAGAIAALQSAGVRVVLLTGDNARRLLRFWQVRATAVQPAKPN